MNEFPGRDEFDSATGADPHIALFRSIGELAAARWRAGGRRRDALPAIAAKVLSEAKPWHGFEVAAFLAALARSPRGADRRRWKFSDLPLIFYRDDQIEVELLIWTDSTTQIHDHGFCGAFAILEGSSLHSTFAFETQLEDESKFALGSLNLKRMETLDRGAVVRIASGSRFIHSAFHLPTPTATLVVRTIGASGNDCQREYHAPGLAVPAPAADPAPALRAEILSLLGKLDPARAEEDVAALARTQDAHTVFKVFDAFPWGELSQAGRRRCHEELLGRPFGAALLAALREKTASHRLIDLRGKLRDREHRLVLGATALLGDLDAVLVFLERSKVSDPPRLMAECIVATFSGDRADRCLLTQDLTATIAGTGEEISAAAKMLRAEESPFAPLFVRASAQASRRACSIGRIAAVAG